MLQLNGPTFYYFRSHKDRLLTIFQQCLTVVQDISTQLFIALFYWLRASVQGDVSEITPLSFSQYSALGSEMKAVELRNTDVFVPTKQCAL